MKFGQVEKPTTVIGIRVTEAEKDVLKRARDAHEMSLGVPVSVKTSIMLSAKEAIKALNK